jgi:aryl-alcohol dehydrogenase-like predicted oxidoreductase
MQPRRLGSLEVAALGLGAPVYEAPSDDAVRPVLDRAIELGLTLVDTSDIYWRGAHEEAVGRALKGRRGTVVLATKFGNIRPAGGTPTANGRPDYVIAACEASLRRLGVDTIDLYYIHRVDPTVPIEETVGAMARLVAQGKVRHLGICEAAPDTLRRAHATHPMAALQTEYSLWSRDPEDALLDLCAELGVGFVAYSPLGRGFLAGAVTSAEQLAADDIRRDLPRFAPENLRHNRALLDELTRLAAREGARAAQLALAWLLGRRPFVVPIPSTWRVTRLEENVAAAALTLSSATVAALDRLFAPGAVAGARYNALQMRRVGL